MADQVVADRYRLRELIGRGGMGEIWRARDELIGREVAVKRIRPFEALDADEREVYRRRALAEARNAGRINHSGVVSVHDIVPGEDGGAVHVVMELVRGPTLLEVLKRDGRVGAERTVDVACQLAQALQAAHALDVVHRDIKPGNIHLLPGGGVKLVDFGIAQALSDPRLTSTTGVMGTDCYMAPEAYEGQQPTPAWDWWSLGVTLHEALDGVNPFREATTAATVRAILWGAIPEPDCQPPLSTVITGLLERNPDQRFTGAEVVELLASAPGSETQLPPEDSRPEVNRTRKWPHGPTQRQSAEDDGADSEAVPSKVEKASTSSKDKESPEQALTFECRSKRDVEHALAMSFAFILSAFIGLGSLVDGLVDPPDKGTGNLLVYASLFSFALSLFTLYRAWWHLKNFATTRVWLSASVLHVSTKHHRDKQTFDARLAWSDIDNVAMNREGEVLLTVPSLPELDRGNVSYKDSGATGDSRLDNMLCLGVLERMTPSGQRLCDVIEHYSGLTVERA